jgi:hypothetical protein
MSRFRRQFAAAVLFLLALALPAAANVRLWPFFYSKTDVNTQQHQLELFWPLYSRVADDHCNVHRIFSFQRHWPTQYPWQAYVFWPMSGLRVGNGHDAWLFPLLWSGSDGQSRFHNSVFPFWVYYRNSYSKTLNVALLNHNSWSKRHHSHYVLPFWWAKWSHYDYSRSYSHGLFPLYSLYKRESSSPNGHELESRRRRGNIALAYWQRRDNHGRQAWNWNSYSSQGLFPLAHFSADHWLNYHAKDEQDLIKKSHSRHYLFPYWHSSNLEQKLPQAPEYGQKLADLSGSILSQAHYRLLLPLYYSSGQASYDGNSKLQASRHSTWLFPYWHTQHTKVTPEIASEQRPPSPAAASASQESLPPQINDFAPPEPQAREKQYERHDIPLLFRKSRSSWRNPDTVPSQVAEKASFYLFPYYRSIYQGTGSDSADNFFLLGGWGSATRKQPTASKQYFYVLPWLYWQKQLQPAAPGTPDLDWAEQSLWLLPYWRQRGHFGALQKRSDFVFPLCGRSHETHTLDSSWWTVFSGTSEQQMPPYRKRSKQQQAQNAFLDADLHSQSRSSNFLFPIWFQNRSSTTHTWNLLPFLWHQDSIDQRSSISSSNTYPLLLSRSCHLLSDQGRESSRHNYLLNLGGWSRTQENSQSGPRVIAKHHHLFPLWYHRQAPYGAMTTMLLPPFSYRVRRHEAGMFPASTHSLAIPHAWLPLYKSESCTKNLKTVSRSSRLFPLYAQEKNTADDFSRLSLLWLLYQREQSRGETRSWGLGGGLTNFYEKDANGFVERSFLYRLYHREERSWFRELELMPFFHHRQHQDGSGGWSILSGLFGSRQDGEVKTTRVFFIPFKSKAASPAAIDQQGNAERHVRYALNYLRARRFDRAAIEFIFAEGTYEANAVILEQAGDAFAQANADHFEEFFRRDLPSSMAKVSLRAERYRKAGSAGQLRQRAVELYQQAIANGASQDDLELKIAICHIPSDRDRAMSILRERFQRTGDFHHGMDFLRLLLRHHSQQDLPKEVIAELCQRYPQQPLPHYLQAMCILQEKITDADRAGSIISQLNCWPAMTPETSAQFAAVLARYVAALEQVIAMPITAYPPSDTLPERQRLPRFSILGTDDKTTDDGLPMPGEIRKMAANELLELSIRKYQALPKHQAATLSLDAEKSLLLSRMMKYLHLLPHNSGHSFSTVCRLHRSHYHDPELLLDELLKQQSLLTTAATTDKISSAGSSSSLAAACAQMIADLRRELSYLTRWQLQLLAGEPSALGHGPFSSSDCGQGYVDLDFFFGGIDRCTVEASTIILADQAQEAILHLGFDHELSAQLNGQHIFGPKRGKIARRDQHQLPITLQAGKNQLKMLVKDDKLSFGFYARLTTPDGMPIFFPSKLATDDSGAEPSASK